MLHWGRLRPHSQTLETRLERNDREHSSLSGLSVSYEENKVLQIRPLIHTIHSFVGTNKKRGDNREKKDRKERERKTQKVRGASTFGRHDKLSS
jgi:hypothetical protein